MVEVASTLIQYIQYNTSKETANTNGAEGNVISLYVVDLARLHKSTVYGRHIKQIQGLDTLINSYVRFPNVILKALWWQLH